MRDIYQAELRSKVPVIVYVSPAGARAASAGVWIGQAADILAMAPQTNIGSSTPIDVGGGNIQSDLRRKVINDAAASLQTLAKNHGRNAQWARLAVTRGVEPDRVPGAAAPRHRRDRAVVAGAAAEDRRHEDRAEGDRPAHRRRGGHAGSHVALEADPRHAHRPEPDRAPAVARGARDHDRDPPPRADLPRHLRRDLADHRDVRASGAADQLGRRPAHGCSPPASSSPTSTCRRTAR